MNRIAIVLLVIYRNYLAMFKLPSCRFEPTCSEYAVDAFQHHPFLRAGGLTWRRIARCHPWGRWGYDPLPARSAGPS